MLPADLRSRIDETLDSFVKWLDEFGPTSLDHQTLYAGPIGGTAKTLYYRHKALGTAAVAPLVFCEALLPQARRVLGRKWRFPIADAHYAMGFAMMSERRLDRPHQRAVRFLESLIASRSPGYERFGWGYPFDWVTQHGTIPAWTPFITSTPYVYEAFKAVHEIDANPRWMTICRSIADHALVDIKEFPAHGRGRSAAYSPVDPKGGVVNAAAYRAWLLTCASLDFDENSYWEAAERNVTFVLESQRPDGAWPYSAADTRDFVDHFHTCFVLKALAKIDARKPGVCTSAIARGVEYYVAHLLDEQQLPKPFAKAPRMTVYRRELYDYAECVNLCVLLQQQHPVLQDVLEHVVSDVLSRWVKRDGSFRSRELLFGWDTVPMHRWAQSQMFRSLAFLRRNSRPATERMKPVGVAVAVH